MKLRLSFCIHGNGQGYSYYWQQNHQQLSVT